MSEKKVDVLERILNCGASMLDVHNVVAELIEASRESLRLLGMDRPVDPSDLLRDALARIEQQGDGHE